jgi:hypothetical protein
MKKQDKNIKNTKICSECYQDKELEEFSKDKSRNDGYTYKCRACIGIFTKSNKEKRKKYNEQNKDRDKKCRENNKSQLNSYARLYYNKNKNLKQQYYQINKKTCLLKVKAYQCKNIEYILKKNKERYNSDVQYKISLLLRQGIRRALKRENNKIDGKTLDMLGCSIEEFKLYLEQQFKPEMNWENHGIIWEIDHIKPCASFDLEDIEQQNECFYYTNHQPLFKTTEIAEQYGYENEIGNRNKNKY